MALWLQYIYIGHKFQMERKTSNMFKKLGGKLFTEKG